MMTPEQRQMAEQIADYVRREVREVGLKLVEDDTLSVWINDGWLLDNPTGTHIEPHKTGIPDLSDDATIDALLRHLMQRGWRMTRWDNKRVEVRKIGCMLFDGRLWSATAKAIKEEMKHES
jgi:hypothetical protein